MRNPFISSHITDADIETALAIAPVSEEIARRDNFFHSCWLKLKFERPDLNDDLNEIELYVAGYAKEPTEEELKKEAEVPSEITL